MNLLLDTHIFLWWIDDAPELGPAARDAIADPGALAPAYARLFGGAAVRLAGGCLSVETGTALLRFTTTEGLSGLHPLARDLAGFPAPWLAALTLAVEDTRRTAACLSTAGVALVRAGDPWYAASKKGSRS